MPRRNRISTLAVVAVAILIAPPSTVAGGDAAPTGGLPNDASRPTQIAPTDDLADYSKQWGVSTDEAALDLARQASAGLLEERLTAIGKGWFGGLWISHDPGFQINIAATDPGNEDLLQLVTSSDVSAFVKVTRVARTIDELTSLQARYQSALDVSSRVRVDVTQNRLTIGSSSPQVARDRLDRALIGLAGGDEIRFDDTRLVLTASIQGGRHLDAGCTSGFGVIDQLGFKYASTAAHCNNSLTYQPGGIGLSFVSQKFSGSVDMQIHTVPSGSTVSNFVYDGGHNFPLDTRPMIGTRTRNAQVVGGTYCKYGRDTGWGCGELQGKWDPCATPAPANTCMFLSRAGVKMANDGDSGGPVFQGFFAAGWIHACFADSFTGQCLATTPLLYIAEDYIAQLGSGMQVLTN